MQMQLTLRLPLLRLGAGGWLLVGIAACAGDVTEESVLSGSRDTWAQAREEAAVESARSLAEQGDADADAREAAVESDRVLAEQGDAGARGRLGEAYYLGDGVALDLGEAVRWARLAAEQGDARGQGVLAAAYNTGNGVALDFGEAVRWARLAAEQGDAGGQAVLGGAYRNGRGGVARDFGEAARWYRLAAEQGNASAQVFLGTMYMSGQGVERDNVSAYMWMTLGASGRGIGGVREALDMLAKFMTPEQIAEAEARARDWEGSEGT